MSKLSKALIYKELSVQIRVYYEDTDAGGVVYHTNYIKYCERARSDVFFANDMPLENDGAFFVVKSLQADFIKSAKLGDMLEVKTEILELKKASLLMRQEIYKDDILIFAMEATLVYIHNGKPTKITEQLYDFFKQNLIG
jgi:acyl-CoA thioester hydrolase